MRSFIAIYFWLSRALLLTHSKYLYLLVSCCYIFLVDGTTLEGDPSILSLIPSILSISASLQMIWILLLGGLSSILGKINCLMMNSSCLITNSYVEIRLRSSLNPLANYGATWGLLLVVRVRLRSALTCLMTFYLSCLIGSGITSGLWSKFLEYCSFLFFKALLNIYGVILYDRKVESDGEEPDSIRFLWIWAAWLTCWMLSSINSIIISQYL